MEFQPETNTFKFQDFTLADKKQSIKYECYIRNAPKLHL